MQRVFSRLHCKSRARWANPLDRNGNDAAMCLIGEMSNGSDTAGRAGEATLNCPALLRGKETCMAKPRRRRKIGSKKRKARRDRRKR
jgi:hypothetical protein